ncbi:MAG: MSEP-CTERM sorting domain-containing protein [Hymenobacter sp.]|nr:MSEP-CTERM sorting domain-containing protein [Hymenobacter sp.]
MRNLLNPKWLLLFNALPVVMLAALCYGEFVVIDSLLPPESRLLWQWFGLALAGLGLTTLGYALWRLGRRPLEPWYAGLTLVAYSAFLCLCAYHGTGLVPRDVPRWMVPTDLLVYVATFLMPTLAHALFVLVVCFTPDERPHRAGRSFALALAVPATWFLLFQVLDALHGWSGASSWLEGASIMAALVLGTVGFLFFLVRGVYIIGLNQADEPSEFALVWKTLISIILPLLGLAVNNGLLFGRFGEQDTGIFGNFTSPWFYGLALLNGGLLCWPNPARKLPRLLLFLGRGVLLGYTFYFFLIFLPYLPFSVFAVILIGTGFLMLTPLVLLVVHLRELGTDYAALRVFYSSRWLRAGLIGGALALPLGVSGSYLYNRHVLHQALAYRYSPDYSRAYRLDENALAATLAVVRQHKEGNSDFLFGSRQPYLSAWFNWLVLDNLTLSDEKITALEHLFLGRPKEVGFQEQPVRPTFTPARAALTALTARSTYDARQQAWVSWIRLTVANPDTTQSGTEYATTLALPVGCWVSGYYLDIGNRREPGILAEKKAAAWVYAQILNENQNRDPGLLSYLDAGHVSLRVFPVVGRAVRTTGIELLHKEPLTLTVDGRQVTLGTAASAPLPLVAVAAPAAEVVYVSAPAKKTLPLVRRQPYYHFLLDVSAGQEQSKAAYQQYITSRFGQDAAFREARFSLVNTYSRLLPGGANWARELAGFPNAGGFYLAGAVRTILFEAHQHPRPTYPVLVVVTDDVRRAVLDKDFADISAAYPENDLFYVLAADGRLTAHSLRTNPIQPLPDTPPPGTPALVRAWPDAVSPRAYLPDNNAADIVANQARVTLPPTMAAHNRWQTGLLLHGYAQWQAFHPEATDQQRVPFIRASFRAGILTPFTSYLALENEAQKAALRRKQAQLLAGNAALDAGESEAQEQPTEVPLDEATGLLLAAGLLLGLWGLRRGTNLGS